MPRRAPRACRHPACPALVTGSRGFCDKHGAQDYREQDRRKRETRPQDKRFYDSAEWKRIREQQLRACPFCVECGNLAQVADHKTPLSQGGEARAFANLQSLCQRCHNAKRARERRLVQNDGAT